MVLLYTGRLHCACGGKTDRGGEGGGSVGTDTTTASGTLSNTVLLTSFYVYDSQLKMVVFHSCDVQI